VSREEVYERAKALLTQAEDQQFARDLYPHVMEIYGRAGWDDPAMDVYNELAPVYSTATTRYNPDYLSFCRSACVSPLATSA